jgi:ABC-type branched-subunit amino acid transport system substrate-binding protein
MTRKLMTILCVLAAAMLVVGCPPKEEKTEAPAETAEKPAEAPAEAPAAVGVTKDTITVGQWGPLTGPAALWGAVARGTAAYFEMINEAGGIHGRKLKLLIRDDSYQAPKTKTAVMELVEKENVFAFVGGVGTGPGMAVKDYLLDKKVPWIGPASGSSKWSEEGNRYLFSLYPQYDVEAKALVRYLIGTAKKNRIAFLYQNDDFGQEGLEAAKAELKAKGLKLAAEVSVEMTDADLKSHILKLKQAKPQAVIMFVMPKHGAIALGTAAKMKFKPLWASASVLSDAPLMHKITKGLWDGVVFTSILELPDSDHPKVKEYKAAYEKYGLKANAKEQWGVFFMAGFLFAEPFVEAVKRAGPELDREKLVKALESLNKWDDGVGHNITFGPEERQGQKAVFIAKCEKGKAVKLTDWIEVE